MSEEVIILSDSDSDGAPQPAKKARTATATQDEVAEFQPAAAPLVAGEDAEGGSDEDIVFVGAVGEGAPLPPSQDCTASLLPSPCLSAVCRCVSRPAASRAPRSAASGGACVCARFTTVPCCACALTLSRAPL